MVELVNGHVSFSYFYIPRCIVFDTERERGINATEVVEKNISSVVEPPEPRLMKSFCRIGAKEVEGFFDLPLYFERARLRVERLFSEIIRHHHDPNPLGATLANFIAGVATKSSVVSAGAATLIFVITGIAPYFATTPLLEQGWSGRRRLGETYG